MSDGQEKKSRACALRTSIAPILDPLSSPLLITHHSSLITFLSNQPRNALKQLARVVHDELEHPRAGDHNGDRHAEQLRNEGQGHFVDLRRRLKHTHE